MFSSAFKYSSPGDRVTFHLSCETEMAIFDIDPPKAPDLGVHQTYLCQPCYTAQNLSGSVGGRRELTIAKQATEPFQEKLRSRVKWVGGCEKKVKLPFYTADLL